MFANILVPVDLTDKHGPALEAAADMAAQAAGTVTLLHVIETITGASREEEKGFYDRLEKAARDHLGRLSHRLKSGPSRRTEILYGNRVAEVVQYARETGADLVVLTAPVFDPANPAASWGSLSYRISLLAPCPILLVK